MLKRIFLVAICISIAACAALQPKTDEQSVKLRAEQRLVAMQQANFKKAYALMSPGYRATNSLRFFEADYIGMVGLKDYEILDANCEVDRCVLSIRAVFSLSGVVGMPRSGNVPGQSELVLRETWIRTDGQWWAIKGR